jgi:hypothetical protein
VFPHLTARENVRIALQPLWACPISSGVPPGCWTS